MISKLTPQLISLVHHVELNRSGWMDETIRQLILTKLATADKPLDITGMADSISTEWSKEIGEERITREVERLLKSFDVTSPAAGMYKISEANRKSYLLAIAAAENIESAVKDIFEAAFSDLPDEIDRTILWSNFVTSYLNPMLSRMGASTFELFAGKGSTLGYLGLRFS